MGYQKRLRLALRVLKDTGSLIKTSLSTKRHISFVRRVILRATTHNYTDPPSDHRVAAVIDLGNGPRTTACACIQALMDRLQRTSNAIVALKCLFIAHNIIAKGPLLLKDQLSVYPSFGGRNFLNLSMFRDDSDSETLGLSTWVRWYAEILEQSLMVSRFLGYDLHTSRANNKTDKVLLSLLNSDLLNQIDALVDFEEQVGNPPESLHLQRKSLVYEVVRFVSESYRFVQREISVRVAELGARMMNMSFSECSRFLDSLNRFEDCKERISELLVNRNRNEDLMDLVKGKKANLVIMMKKKNTLVITMGGDEEEEPSKLTGSSQLMALASRGRWVVGLR